jgi:ketosteroid isomerase-like protein
MHALTTPRRSASRTPTPLHVGRTALDTRDPLAIVYEFDASWNAHDEEAVLASFAEDVVVRLSPPPPPPLDHVSRGKWEARAFVREFLPASHVTNWDHRVRGDTVTWRFAADGEALRRMGANRATGTAEAVLREGKIQAFRIYLDEPTVEKIGAAQGGGFD